MSGKANVVGDCLTRQYEEPGEGVTQSKLSSLALAFNAAWHESSAATPGSLFLGRELNHPLGLKWKLSELDLDKDARSREEFWETALNNLRIVRFLSPVAVQLANSDIGVIVR
ncbi:hypothetical protein B7P43_G14056 [Cryptotermes secundus]|uniref:Reverse transcriptase/retrotransposon-derived protein RNase H-like domain-containing protein n=1 Tax=Cryptotermes secundus TaxID=105785 RepID=A0A2J7PU09_9NEOP|nr:hypothetical protein B7P43_G14056 [Cryptotermes secundus]